MKERRDPVFVNPDAKRVPHAQFGAGAHYLWGNIPAYDCLNLPLNEGIEAAKDMDFVLAFAGRHMRIGL